jgi:hypothetical protein
MRPRALVAIIVLDLVGITSAAGAAGSRISRTLGASYSAYVPPNGGCYRTAPRGYLNVR